MITTKKLIQLPAMASTQITADLSFIVTSAAGDKRLSVEETIAALRPPSSDNNGGSYFQPSVIFTKAEW